MNRRIVTTIAAKDLRLVLTRRSIRSSLIAFPLIVSVGLPLITRFAGHRNGGQGIPASALPRILDSFGFFFVIGAALLPTAIATYSLVGEKVERSLEPLLATPATDGEILLGKALAAALPPIGAIWLASVVFMTLTDAFTHDKLGRDYFPNASILLVLLLVVPLAALGSVGFSVVVSSRVTDVRAGQQLGALVVLPFTGLYVASETGAVTLDTAGLLVVAAVLAGLDLALGLLSRAVFRREEILTRWS
ncbi:ABC transporter permease [Kitasatospora viridis]|uniref:ABC-2 type transport system permease protein n=1 Tax=Kitasatospora viridis TaxID=281105 RepID=A0A561T789_9ACTN|nr:ABC transporter permease [Kitasatospora viridis]TWF82976.1 ABC-2 type transport system permease protein [Kitasatospora viridis]